MRQTLNSNERLQSLMYTNDANTEFTAMVHYLHGTSVAEKYQFDKEKFENTYKFPSEIKTTGMNGIIMLLMSILTSINNL